MKKIVLLGYDGYIGTALVQRLLKENYSVLGIDNQIRRQMVKNMGSYSAIEINDIQTKNSKFSEMGNFNWISCDYVEDFDELKPVLDEFKPDTIVNLAHQPSGPFSMINEEHAAFSLMNNFMGTNSFMWYLKENPDIHYITIGTTGEYDHYNNIEISEGYFSIKYKGRKSTEMIYPRRPTSIYHTSKVASTYLIDYCTRLWNLKCTDVMQAVVFGSYTPEINESKIYTRLDSDESFGTVINRFVVQALLEEPLTVFGEGKHSRGFLSLNDSVQALMIAIKNEPEPGKARVWNQLSEWHSINDIAKMVYNIYYEKFNKKCEISRIDSPRNEYTGKHYYKYVCDILPKLGYEKSRTIEEEINYIFDIINIDYIKKLKDVIIPKINFK